MPRGVPPEIPVIVFATPNKADQGLIELHNTEVARYKPLDVGTAHPNVRDYPGFTLGKQQEIQGDEKWVLRIWVKPETSSDWYNWAQKFSGDSATHPIYIRSYREPKISYSRRANGSALQVVYKLTVTLAGDGYTPGTEPALTFAGGAGSGAVGHGVVSPTGTITEFIITNGGSGYTSAPTFTVAAPPTGTTATGLAFIQPTTAILVQEEAQQYPPDSEFFAQYFNVVRVYETLPGPYLPFTRYDENLGPIQGKRRAVVNSGQVASLTSTVKVTYEAREGSSYVSWEITETNSDGTGSTGNPAFPILDTDFYDDERGAVQSRTQIIIATGSEAGTLTEVTGLVTKTSYEPYNQFLLKKIIETWTVAGPTRTGKRMSDGAQGAITTTTRQHLAASASAYSPDFKTIGYVDTGLDVVRKERSLELVTDSAFPILSDYDIDEETKQTILTTYQVVDAATATTATIATVSSTLVVTKYRHIDKWRSLKSVTTYSTPASYDEQRFGAMSFPTLWDGVYTWSDGCGPFAMGLRGNFSAMVRMRTEVSFSLTKPADIDGLTLIPKTLLMGKSVQLPSDMIMDAGTFTYTGACTDVVVFGGSDPDYTTYTGSIQGTEQLITGEAVKMRGNPFYRQTLVYTYML